MTVGFFLLSRLNQQTSTIVSSLYMLVFGIGIGLTMQILTIAVQNTVEYHDLGVATSGITFLRTLASAPTVSQLVADGYISENEGHIQLSAKGSQSIKQIVDAWHDWLIVQLDDWQPQNDDELVKAVNSIANRIVSEQRQ